jgi:hypothetical protein
MEGPLRCWLKVIYNTSQLSIKRSNGSLKVTIGDDWDKIDSRKLWGLAPFLDKKKGDKVLECKVRLQQRAVTQAVRLVRNKPAEDEADGINMEMLKQRREELLETIRVSCGVVLLVLFVI